MLNKAMSQKVTVWNSLRIRNKSNTQGYTLPDTHEPTPMPLTPKPFHLILSNSIIILLPNVLSQCRPLLRAPDPVPDCLSDSTLRYQQSQTCPRLPHLIPYSNLLSSVQHTNLLSGFTNRLYPFLLPTTGPLHMLLPVALLSTPCLVQSSSAFWSQPTFSEKPSLASLNTEQVKFWDPMYLTFKNV